MNVMAHCTAIDDPYVDYLVDSSTMYPAMIALLRDLADGAETDGAIAGRQTLRRLDTERYAREQERVLSMTQEMVEQGWDAKATPNPIFELYLPQARRLPQVAWELASQPMDEDMSAENRGLRAEALELARHVYTEMFHQTIGGAELKIRLSRDLTYRIRE